MQHFCETCSIQLASKLSYNKHLKTKRHIARIEGTLESSYKCLCGKIFTKRVNLYRHRKNCDVYILSILDNSEDVQSNENDTAQPVTIEDNKNIEHMIGKIVEEKLREKDEKIEQLEKQLLEQKTIINNHTTNNTTNNNNNTTNIYLNSYGNESFEFDAKKIMQYIVNQPNDYFCSMIDDVHFNENHPENQNIKLTEKNGSKIEVFKDDYWQTKMAQEFLLDAIIKYHGIADDIAQSHVNTLQRKYPNQLRKYQKTCDRIYGIDVEDGSKGVEDLVLKTRCVLINGTRKHHTKT